MDAGERRKHDREAVRYTVRVRVQGGGEFDGTVENLGGLGALISTDDLETRFAVGDRIDLDIDLAEKGHVAAAGSVLRLDQEFMDGEIRRAFAVRFDEAV